MTRSRSVMRTVNPTAPVLGLLADEPGGWSVGGEGGCEGPARLDAGWGRPRVTVTRAPARPRVSFSPEAREVGVTAARPSHSRW